MELKNKGDLVINGLGSSNGGQFNLVTLNGRGTINNDIECQFLESNGSGVLKGKVMAQKVKVNGNARFEEAVEAQKVTVDGTARFSGDVLAKKLKISGKAVIAGKVKSEEVNLHGILTVGEDCEAEVFKSKYRFNIGGLLNADHVEVEIYGECKATEIGGQTIIIKQHRGSLIGTLFKPFFTTKLEAELIEGDTIVLENTIAKVVRGNQVKIGANCQIGIVEYRDEFSQDKTAAISDVKRK